MDWAKNVPCKNITIYGFCRYENKGCAFSHSKNGSSSSPEQQQQQQQQPQSQQPRLNGTSAATSNFLPLSTAASSAPSSHTGTIGSFRLADSSLAKGNSIGTSSSSQNNAGGGSSSNSSSINIKKFNVDSQSFRPAALSKFTKLSANFNDIPSFVPLSSLQTSMSAESLPDQSPPQHATNNEESASRTPEKTFSALLSSTNTGSQYNLDSPAFQPAQQAATATATTTNPYVLQSAGLQSSSSHLPSHIQMGSPGAVHIQPAGGAQLNSPLSLRAAGMAPSSLVVPEALASSQPALHQQLSSLHVLDGGPAVLGKPADGAGPDSLINPYSSLSHHQPPEMFFTPPSVSYPLQYHLYAPNPLLDVNFLAPNERNAHALFLPNELRETLLKQNEATLQTLQHSSLPEHVSVYHTLVPLDRTLKKSSRNYGVPSAVYKVFSNRDGNPYVLRRIEGFQLTNERSLSMVARWKKLHSNANVVRLHEAFTSLAFGDNSLYFVHDFHPLSKSLRDVHQCKPKSVGEPVLWSYVAQITSALLAIHGESLAARVLSLDKVILVGPKNRIKLSGAGILDVIKYDTDVTEMGAMGFETRKEYYVGHLQKEDLRQFGQLVLELVYYDNGVQLPHSRDEQSLKEAVAKASCSEDVRAAVSYLLGYSSKTQDIETFSKLVAPFAFRALNDTQGVLVDYYEAQLRNEIENGRLFRLLAKMNFVIDRPEYEGDMAWSETGERYPVKLFRDYLFHQTDQEGRAVLDLAHVLRNLNKLDVGLDEKILLVSKDEASCIIASFKELKGCIDVSFRALMKR